MPTTNKKKDTHCQDSGIHRGSKSGRKKKQKSNPENKNAPHTKSGGSVSKELLDAGGISGNIYSRLCVVSPRTSHNGDTDVDPMQCGKQPGDLLSRLEAFLPQMEAANTELLTRDSGSVAEPLVEIVACDSESEDSDSDAPSSEHGAARVEMDVALFQLQNTSDSEAEDDTSPRSAPTATVAPAPLIQDITR